MRLHLKPFANDTALYSLGIYQFAIVLTCNYEVENQAQLRGISQITVCRPSPLRWGEYQYTEVVGGDESCNISHNFESKSA